MGIFVRPWYGPRPIPQVGHGMYHPCKAALFAAFMAASVASMIGIPWARLVVRQKMSYWGWIVCQSGDSHGSGEWSVGEAGALALMGWLVVSWCGLVLVLELGFGVAVGQQV